MTFESIAIFFFKAYFISPGIEIKSEFLRHLFTSRFYWKNVGRWRVGSDLLTLKIKQFNFTVFAALHLINKNGCRTPVTRSRL